MATNTAENAVTNSRCNSDSNPTKLFCCIWVGDKPLEKRLLIGLINILVLIREQERGVKALRKSESHWIISTTETGADTSWKANLGFESGRWKLNSSNKELWLSSISIWTLFFRSFSFQLTLFKKQNITLWSNS